MKLVSIQILVKKRSGNFYYRSINVILNVAYQYTELTMNPIVFSLTVFLAGILSFFSPCVFPLLPVYIGILLGSDQEKAIRLFGKRRFAGMAC